MNPITACDWCGLGHGDPVPPCDDDVAWLTP